MGEMLAHTPTVPPSAKQVHAPAHISIANSQVLTKLTPAQRMALALAPKGGNFNTTIPKSQPLGTSAAARARAAI